MLAALSAAVLAACGGGGAGGIETVTQPVAVVPDTLNGTALTGAALANATVTVKDSTGKACVTATTNAQGSWSASLAECGAAPYLIKVTGNDVSGVPVTYFSAATSSDVNSAGSTTKTVNVSQLTDVIVKVLLKTDTPDTVPAATLVSSVTNSNLQITSENTLAALVPVNVLSTLGMGDIRTMAVVPGSGTGLDGLHDKVPAIEVTVSGGTLSVVATVTNVNANGATAVTATTVATAAAPTAALVAPPAGAVINNVTVTTPAALATLTPEELVIGEVTQMLRDWNKVYAAGVPAATEGVKAFGFTDACYLDDGQDKPGLIARWVDPADTIRDASKYRIGATRSNLNIVPLSLKVISNADGSKMRIVKVKYDISYTDGTTAKQALNTLVFGNSAKACADDGLVGTGENRTAWRFLGNRRQVETNVNPVNVQYKKFSLADGSAISAGDYRENRLEFGIYDYRLKGYTYAVLTGQGLPASGIKLLMANTLKTASELVGKNSAFTNTTGFDGARICKYVIPAVAATANTAAIPAKNAWDATLADCAAYGGSSPNWVFSDTGLAGLSVGTPYTFKLYKGDGWKTVNGHNGVTPDATYTDELPAVPYSAAQFASTGFASFGTTGTTITDLVVMIRGAGGNATTNPVNVTGLPAGANAMARRSMWGYSNGKVNSTDVYASLKQINRIYPNNTDASVTAVIPGKMAAMSAVSYAEVGFSSIDRNGRSINTIYFFQ